MVFVNAIQVMGISKGRPIVLFYFYCVRAYARRYVSLKIENPPSGRQLGQKGNGTAFDAENRTLKANPSRYSRQYGEESGGNEAQKPSIHSVDDGE